MKYLILLLCIIGCGPASPLASKPDFEASEHGILGDEGFLRACKGNPWGCRNRFVRHDGKLDFSYGELVAISGDFYEHPDDIFYEKDRWRIFGGNNIKGVKELILQEYEVIRRLMEGEDIEYPDFKFSYIWNVPQFLTLALGNIEHFGWFNMKAYARFHRLALAIAEEAFKAPEREKKSLLRKALFYNAFADHFLTDGFSSGHIRIPRVEILKWAKEAGYGSQTAGLLAKIIHDRDGEVRQSGHPGLLVENARGDSWWTRGDAQLFWQNNLDDSAVEIPIEAVKISVSEVYGTFRSGKLPKKFAAIALVPFPAADAESLVEVFPSSMDKSRRESIVADLSCLERTKIISGLDEELLKHFFESLPTIMANFATVIREESAAGSEELGRFPDGFIDGYKNIH